MDRSARPNLAHHGLVT